jgi:hypothetical protein
MTHSLHRTGTRQSLKNDYVFLATPAIGFNEQGSGCKLRTILDIVCRAEPVNIGSYEVGTILAGASPESIKKSLTDGSRVRCVFSDIQAVQQVLEELKGANLGISVVVSGLLDEVLQLAQRVGLQPHTINYSLGFHGRVERLPKPIVLDLMTMCGHGMVSSALVEQLVGDVLEGHVSPDKAAETMAKPCVCGIFNQARARALLESLR